MQLSPFWSLQCRRTQRRRCPCWVSEDSMSASHGHLCLIVYSTYTCFDILFDIICFYIKNKNFFLIFMYPLKNQGYRQILTYDGSTDDFSTFMFYDGEKQYPFSRNHTSVLNLDIFPGQRIKSTEIHRKTFCVLDWKIILLKVSILLKVVYNWQHCCIGQHFFRLGSELQFIQPIKADNMETFCRPSQTVEFSY